jgi:NAD(P)-dependent dehydrogenase (short-subunit alcohol dehydrogenase family)
MSTILITGASSGYGRETAHYFHQRGWSVIATMRRPEPGILPESDRMRLLPLDVTDPGSIAACIVAAGPIDVLVNNAGVGMGGAFEAASLSDIRRIFETNTFGVMAMIQAVLPAMRERGSGVVVNVTSSATLAAFPFAAPYTASKTAIEGLSEALVPELAPFGLKVKLVEPGLGLSTRFAQNSAFDFAAHVPAAYAAHATEVFSARPAASTRESDVAEAVWRAAHDTTGQLRFPAGADALDLWDKRSW